jgi:CRISPR-associated protein Csd1
MSWLEKLYETYEAVSNIDELSESLEPYFHKKEQCHIEIVLDEESHFIRAEPLVHEVSYGKQTYWKGDDTVIPITPKSLTGRTRGAAPYPLSEQIQYVAKDYPDFGGAKKSYFREYFELLNSWSSSGFTHFKVDAIAKYVAKGTVVRDLLKAGILFSYMNDGKKNLITNWSKQGPCEKDSKKKLPKPPLLNAVNKNEQGNVKIRWRVQRPGDADELTWNDPVLVKKWQDFQIDQNKENGLCQILGKKSFIASNHPKGVIPKANDAKLISVPSDESYLTFKGRFTNADQPCALSFEVSQKAHNVLRWLIARQGYHNNEQVFVTWAVSGKSVPDPLGEIWAVLGEDINIPAETEENEGAEVDHTIDIGQSFALRLNKYIAGYLTDIQPTETIVVLGLDAATKGRMGITYYRELLASEFLKRLEDWHTQFAWPQRHTVEIVNEKDGKELIKKTIWSVSSPVPQNIAEAAYGDILKSNAGLKKNLLERIMPCIVDGRPFPRDVLMASVRRGINPMSYKNDKKWLWERDLGITCALYKGFYQRHPDNKQRRGYAMTLEESNDSRDYLYGRLLAIAERIEEIALNVAGEKARPTTAQRLMQRFADHPFSTWRNIELALQPYMQRLQSSRAPFLHKRKKELDTVLCALSSVDDSTRDKPLSGEFLLGYHCQRLALHNTQPEIPQQD